MSGRLVGEVFRYAPEDLTPVEMLVLVAIAEQARDTDRTARYASTAILASHTRRKPGTVRNALSELVSRGLIQRVHDRAHTGKIQQYRITELAEHHRQSTSRQLPVAEVVPQAEAAGLVDLVQVRDSNQLRQQREQTNRRAHYPDSRHAR